MNRRLLLAFLSTFWGQVLFGAVLPATAGPDDFFGLTNVWTLHLRLSPAAWRSLEPTQPQRPSREEFHPRPSAPEEPGNPPAGPGPGPNSRRPTGPRPGPMNLVFPWATGTVEFEGQVWTNVRVRFKGNSSFNGARESRKKPFKLDFDAEVSGRRFFGLEELFLNNNVNELAHLREPLAYDAFRRASLPAPRTAFVRLTLTVTGEIEAQPLGLYTAVEPVESDFLRRTFGTRKGLLVKPEGIRGLEYLGPDPRAYTNRYELRSTYHAGDLEQLQRLTRFVQQANETEFQTRLEDYLDVEATLRFIAMNALLANLDSFLGNGHNYYLFIERKSGHASFIPWDLNEAFGGHPPGGPARDQADFTVLQPAPNNRFIGRLLGIPSYQQRYRAQLEGLLTNAFRVDRIVADAQRIAATVGEVEPLRRPPQRGPNAAPDRLAAFTEWVQLRATKVRAELDGQRVGTTPIQPCHFGPPRARPEPF